jgi:hypothetical protein
MARRVRVRHVEGPRFPSELHSDWLAGWTTQIRPSLFLFRDTRAFCFLLAAHCHLAILIPCSSLLPVTHRRPPTAAETSQQTQLIQTAHSRMPPSWHSEHILAVKGMK